MPSSLFAALWLWGGAALPWAFEVPRAWRPSFAAWIGGFLKWLTDEAHFGLFTFRDLTRAVAAVIDVPYRLIALGLRVSGEGRNVFGVPCRRWPGWA